MEEKENRLYQPTFEFLAPPKGDLPPRCCAKCRNSLYYYEKRLGMVLKCMSSKARAHYKTSYHPKDDEPKCRYFVAEATEERLKNKD